MKSNKIESGVQLFSRLCTKSGLNGLNPILFTDGGPNCNQNVEIVGDVSLDKSYFLMDLLARSILPPHPNTCWKNSKAILMLLQHKINLLKVIKVIDLNLKKHGVQNRKEFTENALKNLTVLNCYDHNDFFITCQSLENIIRNNDVSLVVVDNLCSQYWAERLVSSQKLSLKGFALQNFDYLNNLIKGLNVVLVFSRDDNSVGKKAFSNKIDYRLEVKHVKDLEFECIVFNYEQSQEFSVIFKHDKVIEFEIK